MPPMPWCDAEMVGPPLVHYFRGKKDCGEDFPLWITVLRLLNKSWYLEMNRHIQKVIAERDTLEQLPRSLMGSLAHVTDLSLLGIGIEAFACDEGAGSPHTNEDPLLNDVVNSAANIQTLNLDFQSDSVTEIRALISMTSLKTLAINRAQSLEWVQKCPNLENLILEDCCLTNTEFQCTTQLRRLAIDAPDIQNLRIDNIFEEPNWIMPILVAQPFNGSFLTGLGKLTKLTELRFSFRLRELWDHFEAMCETFNGLKNLKVLSLVMTNDFELGEELKLGFLNALPPSLRELDVWGLLSWVDNRVLREITSLDSLEKLTFGNGDGVASFANMDWVTKLPNLVEVTFWGFRVEGRAFDRFRDLPKLRRVVLNVEGVSPDAFRQLCWVGENLEEVEVFAHSGSEQEVVQIAEVIRLLEERGVQAKWVPKLSSKEWIQFVCSVCGI
ncbi:hypothetical protein BSKO_13172 [Bryopsis sp. KO-2023]|nr:hypothetical protein BSKO_13172 [Bryopsis sp. KO-2023]